MADYVGSEQEKGHEDGQITYATEVISTIVNVATTEVEGISGIVGGGSISGIIGKGRAPRGVKVDVNDGNVSVDLSVTVDYGIPIQKVGRNCQENVRKSVESMTGLHVEKVDLHVVGVSFEKENQEMQQSQKLALTLEAEEETHALEEPAAPSVAAEEAPAQEETASEEAQDTEPAVQQEEEKTDETEA